MTSTITIINYRKWFIPFALVSNFIFRLPLWYNSKISCWKLMGTGKNGSFDQHINWQQWIIFTVHPATIPIKNLSKKEILNTYYGTFITAWIRFFNCETYTLLLAPIEGHGLWNGKNVFGNLAKETLYSGPMLVLTRATIALSKLRQFWQAAKRINVNLNQTKGLLMSLGAGEIPLLRQATLSIWLSKEHMKDFAYHSKEHAAVIQKTKNENIFKEEMYIRFRIVKQNGTLNGCNPLEGKL